MKKISEERRCPPRKPYEPHEPKREHYNTQGAVEHKTVYHDVGLIADCDIDLEQYFEDMDEKLPHPALNYNQVTLQDIVDLAPPGAKLSDIKLHISYPRMVEYLEVKFIYSKRDLEAEERAFLHAKEKYEKEYAQYLVDMKKYNEELADFQAWQKEQEIKQLEEKLAHLKR